MNNPCADMLEEVDIFLAVDKETNTILPYEWRDEDNLHHALGLAFIDRQSYEVIKKTRHYAKEKL